jgi:hypothetical protein
MFSLRMQTPARLTGHVAATAGWCPLTGVRWVVIGSEKLVGFKGFTGSQGGRDNAPEVGT